RLRHGSGPARATRVLLVAHEGERDPRLEPRRAPMLVQTHRRRRAARDHADSVHHPEVAPQAARRVLVFDDDRTTSMLLASMHCGLLHATVTSDEWEALDQPNGGL